MFYFASDIHLGAGDRECSRKVERRFVEWLDVVGKDAEAIFLLGTENDSTATVIELISANSYPTISFMMLEDSSLVKVGNNGMPASMHKDHRLKIKK